MMRRDRETCGRALFEAHRDLLDPTNTARWEDLSPRVKQRYKDTAQLFLINLHIPLQAGEDNASTNES